MPFSRGKKPVATSRIPKLGSKGGENQELPQVKRSSSPPKGAPKKRTAFIDITNAFSQCLPDSRIEDDDDGEVAYRAHKTLGIVAGLRKRDGVKKPQTRQQQQLQSASEKNEAKLKKSASVESETEVEPVPQVRPLAVEPVAEPLIQPVALTVSVVTSEVKIETEETIEVPIYLELQPALASSAQASAVKLEVVVKNEEAQEEAMAVKQEQQEGIKEEVVTLELQLVKEEEVQVKEEAQIKEEAMIKEELIKEEEEKPAHLLPPQIPPEFDIDSENSHDIALTPEYAMEIFDYLKKREEKFVLKDYLPLQPSLTLSIRGILVDWMVEVQENFELNHETLYLAVKLTDHFLATKPSVSRDLLQLLGATAMLLAAKFEERCPPCIDDFLYICDDAYKRHQFITMEMNILQTLDFDISIPISYRFLRRYSKCVHASMEVLTLARFVCESSLVEMDFVSIRDSLQAAACLLIALVTKDVCGWTPCLEFHSGYTVSEVAPVARRLHSMLLSQREGKLEAVRNKYSHPIFFEVAQVPIVSLSKLEEFLQ